MISENTNAEYPQIHNSAYIHPSAVVIGNVKICENVFVGPRAIIRADEPGSSIFIGNNCNVQDGVIIHSLYDSSVFVDDNTSLSHGCIIHGPCKIGKNCFIGFGSVIFKAELYKGVIVKYLAVVEKVIVPSKKIVESLSVIDDKIKAEKLKNVDKEMQRFTDTVVCVNQRLADGYKKIHIKKCVKTE